MLGHLPESFFTFPQGRLDFRLLRGIHGDTSKPLGICSRDFHTFRPMPMLNFQQLLQALRTPMLTVMAAVNDM
jgi:hypothetical protein